MNERLADLGWPGERLGEALEALARRAGLAVAAAAAGDAQPPPFVLKAPERLDGWVGAAARSIGLEAEPVHGAYPEATRLLARAGPALVRMDGADGPRFLAVLDGNRRVLRVVTLERWTVRVPTEVARAEVCRAAEATVAGDVDRILDDSGVARRRRPRARAALLDQLLADADTGALWLLRPAAGGGLVGHAREARLPGLLALLLAAQALASSFGIGSWWLLGAMATTGQLDRGWLCAWLLLVLSTVPCQVAVTAAAGAVAIRAGGLVKRRLLAGALALDHDEARRAGLGQLYGLVLESDAIELMGLSGGFLALAAALELALAVPVLALGAGGWAHAGLLAATVLATLALGARFYRCRAGWTAQRIAMTNDLVEQMVGHRTRLAQEPPELRNADEDRALERYLGASRTLDGLGAGLHVLAPRGWLLIGLLGLAPTFVAGDAPADALAVGLGGTLLAYRALRSLAEALEKTSAAAVAWTRVKELWHAAERTEPVGVPDFATPPPRANDPAGARPRLDARGLVYRYRGWTEAVLDGASLSVGERDRILIEGRSGGGKSTLAALLAGLRVPASGLLLWDGLDRATLGGEAWRRRVAMAPQFHENRVLMGTLAFNLLMGRAWPPTPADLQEAERVCRALGLGPLLDRMPAGLLQVVGETGWQLSHGERSRLYLARALLQQAELVILDESFAALDPPTLRDTLGYVLKHAPALVVVAHP